MTQIDSNIKNLTAPSSPSDVECALLFETVCDILADEVLEVFKSPPSDIGPVMEVEAIIISTCYQHLKNIFSAYAQGDMDEVSRLINVAKNERASITALRPTDLHVLIASLFSLWTEVPIHHSHSMFAGIKDAIPTYFAIRSAAANSGQVLVNAPTAAAGTVGVNRQQRRSKAPTNKVQTPKNKKRKKR